MYYKKCDAIIKNESLSQVVWIICSLKIIPGCTLDSYLLMKNILNNSVQFSSAISSCPTLCNSMDCSMRGLPVHHKLPEFFKLMSTDSVMPFNHLILSHPLFLPPSIFPSITVFSSESALHIRWPKYWSFRFNSSPSNEYSGLISFRLDWLDLLAVQGTLKSLLQHHMSKEHSHQRF